MNFTVEAKVGFQPTLKQTKAGKDMVNVILENSSKNKTTGEWNKKTMSVMLLGDLATKFVSEVAKNDKVKIEGFFSGEYKKDIKRTEYTFFGKTYEVVAKADATSDTKVKQTQSSFEINADEIPF